MSNFRIYNETLNPDLWGSNQNLDPKVRMNLLQMAYDFYEKTKFPAPVLDVYLMGSLSNYNWTADSDIDVHVIIDYSKLQMPTETANKAIKTAGAQWNAEHEITIKGFKVEMNIQNFAEQKPYVTGIYSLVKGQWIRKPFKMPIHIDRNVLRFQYWAMKNYVQTALDSGDREQMKASKKYLDAYRQYGLDTYGELSYENIIFKILRARGIIKKLKDFITSVYDQEMTVNEMDYIGSTLWSQVGVPVPDALGTQHDAHGMVSGVNSQNWRYLDRKNKVIWNTKPTKEDIASVTQFLSLRGIVDPVHKIMHKESALGGTIDEANYLGIGLFDYWMSPDFELHRVKSHLAWAIDYLDSKNIKHASMKGMGMKVAGGVSAYDIMYKLGWVRIIISNSSQVVYYEPLNISSKKIKEVKDIGIEHGAKYISVTDSGKYKNIDEINVTEVGEKNINQTLPNKGYGGEQQKPSNLSEGIDDVYIGYVDTNGVYIDAIPVNKTRNSTCFNSHSYFNREMHRNVKWDENKIRAWRYRKDTGIVFWWSSVSDEVKDEVVHWIEKNIGGKVRGHKITQPDPKLSSFRAAHGNDSVQEGFGSGIPEDDRLKIKNEDNSTRRWQIRSKDAPKTPKMTDEVVIAVPKFDKPQKGNCLTEGIIKESKFRGEWWFEDGQAIYADGDVGDTNHEGRVINILKMQIVDELGGDTSNDVEYAGEFDDYADEIFEHIGGEFTPEELEDWKEGKYFDAIKSYIVRAGSMELKEKFLYAFSSNKDAREYALKYWGWQRVKGNVIQTWTLTTQDLKNITSGLYEAYDEELNEPDAVFFIEVMTTRSFYEDVPWRVLQKDNPTALNAYRTRY